MMRFFKFLPREQNEEFIGGLSERASLNALRPTPHAAGSGGI
jgi:hypothetical protein